MKFPSFLLRLLLIFSLLMEGNLLYGSGLETNSAHISISLPRSQKSSQTKRKTQPAKKKTPVKTTNSQSKKSVTKSTPKTSGEAKKKQAETKKEIQLTEAEIRENDAKVKENLAQLGKIDLQIEATTKRVNDLTVTLHSLNSQIESLEKSIQSNESHLSLLRDEYLKAVKKMRSSSKNKSTLAFIFSSKNFNQALRRMRYLREFSAWRTRRTTEINENIKLLETQRKELSAAKSLQEKNLAEQTAAKKRLAIQQAEQQTIISRLKENGKALQAHLQRKQAEARELDNMISQLIAEEQRKAAEEQRKAAEEARRKSGENTLADAANASEAASSSTSKSKGKSTKSNSSTSKNNSSSKSSKGSSGSNSAEYANARKRAPRGNDASNSGFQVMKGKLPLPVNGSFYITSRFGRQTHPELPDVEFDNPGIDAETDPGASARAVYKGQVSGVYRLPGYNTVVIVNHGNFYTVYGNILSPSVKNGDEIEAGTLLGQLSSADNDTSHSIIHFEVWKNRQKLNPQEWLILQ